MTISERVLSYLKEQPGVPAEIGKALKLTRKGWLGFYWGHWNFAKAEDEGLIEWKNGKWHLKEVEMTGEVIRCYQCKHYKRIGAGAVGWCQHGSGKVRVRQQDFCDHAEKKEGAD